MLLNDAIEFQNITETEEAPIAKAFFGFEAVTGIFITNNFVTITKDGIYVGRNNGSHKRFS